MIHSSNERDSEKMRDAVKLRQTRRERWAREGERSLRQNLSMIGSLGWLIVVPTLLGVFIGNWLDKTYDSGIFFSGAFIFVGICVGCYLAWQRVNSS